MSESMQKILVIEDDKNTATLVATYLQKEGYATLIENDGVTGLQVARKDNPALVILDLMLPGIDGLEICRHLRNESNIPILMLTAREEEIDRVLGFSLGADDYVVKPFSPRELVKRVKAILRRTHPPTPAPKVLQWQQLLLDPEKHKVSLGKKIINLTTSEYKLLYTLMASPGRVFSRAELLKNLYQQEEAVIERVIDVHINKLRQKIEADPGNPTYIETVRGFGYCFADTGSQ
ncbi:Transcriptional regulatory protein, C terminal [Desulfuromusa kysingii]|uniref:Phosphate regulon transcriptional regulatory protein PhoB n=1 Tax=Desulfuromusa kysingii TaxID=37625 RepID=A0A1H4E5H8_9BACT|nr:response regulator transcription factor [Desulfuromusa kysingii]SEA80018.1 Transcriptional regulatory protein, C terminal [Desulfuromusa kysingii]